MEEKIEKSIEEFKKYVNTFDFSNDKISRKYFHTFRVVDYAKDLAKYLNLNEHDSYIAIVCALLHDIARFKQATEFNTFSDLESFDHGDVGYDILLENNYIFNFVDNDIDKNIVLNAVKYHNKFSVPNSLNERELLFANLVRDADKLDIMDKQKKDINDGFNIIDEVVINTVKSHSLFKRDGIKRNDASKMIIKLCFIFDFNFQRSYNIILEKKMVENNLNVLKQHCDLNLINEIEKIFLDYINDKIK